MTTKLQLLPPLAECAQHLWMVLILLSGREDAGHGFPLIRKPFMKDDLTQVMARHTGLC
jgi:hypothetical protein